MPRSDDQTRTLFDRWAGSYDDDLRSPDGPLAGYARSLRAAAALVPLQPGTDLLDVGIGTGAFAAFCGCRGVRVSGIDVSAAMLAVCRRSYPDFALTTGSFAPTRHPDRRFDAVVSSFAFHEIAPAARADACAELARVLRAGGWVCLLDIMFASAAATAEARRRLGNRWDPDEDYPLVGDLDALLATAGFVGRCWRQTAMCH